MSKWKFTKEELASIDQLGLKEFLVGYEVKLSEMMVLLAKINEKAEFGMMAQESLYILRQLSVNVEKFGAIYRKKSIQFMKEHEEKKRKDPNYQGK